MRSIKYLFTFVVLYSFCFLSPSKIFAQTTVSFTLVILPAQELKQEVIPEIVEKVDDNKSFVEMIKLEEPSKDNSQQKNCFDILFQEAPNIDKKVEVTSNNVSENQTQEITYFEIHTSANSKNIRAGPS